MTDETWYPLPGFPRYSATADGRVRGSRGKELRPFAYDRPRSSVAAVNLYCGGEMVRRGIGSIRRMVAEAMRITA